MRLVRANVSDCEKIWSMQIEAFQYHFCIAKISLRKAEYH